MKKRISLIVFIIIVLSFAYAENDKEYTDRRIKEIEDKIATFVNKVSDLEEKNKILEQRNGDKDKKIVYIEIVFVIVVIGCMVYIFMLNKKKKTSISKIGDTSALSKCPRCGTELGHNEKVCRKCHTQF